LRECVPLYHQCYGHDRLPRDSNNIDAVSTVLLVFAYRFTEKRNNCVGKLRFTVEFLSFFVLPEHGAQQPRRGRPSNVYQRFGHRCSYYH